MIEAFTIRRTTAEVEVKGKKVKVWEVVGTVIIKAGMLERVKHSNAKSLDPSTGVELVMLEMQVWAIENHAEMKALEQMHG
jgi:hypothetical protein